MALERSLKYCPHCNADRYAERPPINHILHFLISFFTCGLWAIVWAIMAMARDKWRCLKCGNFC